MNNTRSLLIIMALFLTTTGCSYEYMMSARNQKKLAKKQISREQYDSIINKLYKTNRYNFKNSEKVKKEGSYVYTRPGNSTFKTDYIALKFTDSSLVFASYQFDTLSNEVLSKTHGTRHRYTTNQEGLVLEYLLTRDFNIHHVFNYARVSENGDTLVFYKTRTSRRENGKFESEKEDIYIYYSTLTAIPIMPK